MAVAYPIMDLFSERHMETIDGKIQSCKHVIDACLNLMLNPMHLKSVTTIDSSCEYLVKVGDFFQELSHQISIFGLDNYLHEIVTPGVPHFGNPKSRISFWMCICSNKLITLKKYLQQYLKEYLDKPEGYKDPKFYNDLYHLITDTNHSIQKMYFLTPL